MTKMISRLFGGCRPDTKSTTSKNPALIITWLVLFGAAAITIDSRLFPLFNISQALFVKIAVAYVILWMHIVWFYGAFHIGNVLFSLIILAKARVGKKVTVTTDFRDSHPSIAVLYTTKNDFCVEAAESCVNQQFANFHVYLLDDSTLQEEQTKIDAFSNCYPDKTTVVRRKQKRGFKAGNLNHALKTVASDCDYFAVVDADEILPANFLGECAAHLIEDSQLAFVQANHEYWQSDESKFAENMSSGVDLHWNLFLTARNRFGFVMFYGHGAVIRKRVWDEIGGFPEIVSEDIAFATRAREKGYHGKFLPHVVAKEAFPRTYKQFERRETKVVKGTLAFAQSFLKSFLSCKNVSWVEKFDLIATNFMLFLHLPFVLFLLLANVILPLVLSMQADANQLLNIIQPLETNLRSLWTWDFFLITFTSIMAPLFYQLPSLINIPVLTLKYVARSTPVYLSLCPKLSVEILKYFRKPQVTFESTADRAFDKDKAFSVSFASIILGGLLTVFALLIHNFALLTISFSFLFVFFLQNFGWDNKAVRLIIFVPFLFFASVFIATPFLLAGVVGLTSAIVPQHH